MTEKEKMLNGKPYKAFGEELFSKVGKDLFIEPPFRCDYGYNISIGDNFYCNYNCTILTVQRLQLVIT